VFSGDRSQWLVNLAAVVALLAVTMSVGCERRVVSAPPLPAPTVEVASVIQKDVPIEGEWIGTLDGYVNAQIQPHVTGYLIRLDYQEGGFVRQGQMLFEIDPRPFQAASGSPRTSHRPQCSWPLTRQVG
jgi:multidrug efflux pump subunit AcrA (membrane-fusion protein)